jgi:hypothetical protein
VPKLLSGYMETNNIHNRIEVNFVVENIKILFRMKCFGIHIFQNGVTLSGKLN